MNEKMSRQVDVKALVSHIVRGDGNDRCRICLGDTTEGQVYLGDTVMMDGDKPITLSELLETITGVEVLSEADVPSGVCSDCTRSALAAEAFRSLCQKSVNRWNLILELLNSIPDSSQVDHLESLYAVIEDNRISFVENEIKFFEDKPDIKNIETSPKVVKRPKNKPIRKSCYCPECNKRFKSPRGLYEHFKESTDSKRACFVCALIMTRKELIRHLKESHRTSIFGCKKCPALFQTVNQFKNHVYQAHSPGSIHCTECGRTFKSIHAFNGHSTKHSSKSCPNCNTLFRNRKCYVHHVQKCCNLDKNRQDTHHTKNKVSFEVENKKRKVQVGVRGSADEVCICDYCNKTFSGKRYVKSHIQIVHTKETHRPCPYCGKSLASAHMTEHIKKHEKSRSYTCEHCGVILNTRLGYVQHIRLHTGEKPYACKYCTETFSASSRRSEHVRLKHKAEELIFKHICKLCPARFRLPFQLKKHVESAHGENRGKDFQCPECHVKFPSCRALLYHTRKHQASKNIERTVPTDAKKVEKEA